LYLELNTTSFAGSNPALPASYETPATMQVFLP